MTDLEKLSVIQDAVSDNDFLNKKQMLEQIDNSAIVRKVYDNNMQTHSFLNVGKICIDDSPQDDKNAVKKIW